MTTATVLDSADGRLGAVATAGSGAREPVVGSLCTGAGGLDLGVLAALGGGRIAWCADPDPHIRIVLAARLPGVPNLGDLRTVDWTQVEPVDVLTAGFPCQDISAAGHRAGIDKGARSGLWTHIVAAVRHLRPALLVVENVAALRWKNGGLHRVLGDLATLGFDALWRSVRASDVEAAHRRERVFLLGWPSSHRQGADAADAASPRRPRPRSERPGRADLGGPAGESARCDHHRLGVVADAHGDQPQRQRGPRPLAGSTRPAPGSADQRQRDGDAAVDRGAAVADANGCGCEELHPPHPDRRPIAARSGSVVADADRARRQLQRDQRDQPARGTVAAGPSPAPAHPEGDRRDEGLPPATRLQGRPHAALGSPAPAQARPAEPDAPVDWAAYEPAIRRWEHRLGRLTPHPTQPGRHGRPVLSPRFVEHLMGLSPGWVTDLDLPRTAQLRALGNGVVPQQAAHAVALLLADLHHLTSACPSAGEDLEAVAA